MRRTILLIILLLMPFVDAKVFELELSLYDDNLLYTKTNIINKDLPVYKKFDDSYVFEIIDDSNKVYDTVFFSPKKDGAFVILLPFYDNSSIIRISKNDTEVLLIPVHHFTDINYYSCFFMCKIKKFFEYFFSVNI